MFLSRATRWPVYVAQAFKNSHPDSEFREPDFGCGKNHQPAQDKVRPDAGRPDLNMACKTSLPSGPASISCAEWRLEGLKPNDFVLAGWNFKPIVIGDVVGGAP